MSQPNFKRRELGEDDNEDDHLLFNDDINNLTIDDGNSTRRATDEELDAMGYVRCKTRDCEAERQQILDLLIADNDATFTAPAMYDVSGGPITIMAQNTGTVEAGTLATEMRADTLAAEMRAGVTGQQSQPTPTTSM